MADCSTPAWSRCRADTAQLSTCAAIPPHAATLTCRPQVQHIPTIYLGLSNAHEMRPVKDYLPLA